MEADLIQFIAVILYNTKTNTTQLLNIWGYCSGQRVGVGRLMERKVIAPEPSKYAKMYVYVFLATYHQLEPAPMLISDYQIIRGWYVLVINFSSCFYSPRKNINDKTGLMSPSPLLGSIWYQAGLEDVRVAQASEFLPNQADPRKPAIFV